MLERYASCVDHAEALVSSGGDPADALTLQRLRALTPTVRQWAADLAGSAVPPSLDHNDLHAWNLLCPDGDLGHPRTYDWGDAVVGHPFASLMVVLRGLTDGGSFGPDSPQVHRVRDAYLAEFEDLAPYPALLRDLELADRSARVGRALSWIAVLDAGGETAPGELAGAPLHWLSTLL